MNYPESWTTGGEVTILIADQPVAKTWRNGEAIPYPDVYFWRVRQINVCCLEELFDEVCRVAEYRKACIVRGFPLDKYDEPVRRLVHPCRRTKDAPTFEHAPAGLRWVCIDVDGVPTDYDPATHPDEYAEDARRSLPHSLRNGRCFYQLSASAGMKDGARVHLWYWLERRAHDLALREWAPDSIDASLFSAVQPHYVVPPVFVGPAPDWGEMVLPDPISKRMGWLPGTPEVWPAGLMGVEKWREHQHQEELARAAVEKARAARPAPSVQRVKKRGEGAIAHTVSKIESTGPGGRNAAICRGANFLGRVASSGAITLDEARNALEQAARNALGSEWSARGRTTTDAIAQCLDTGFAAGDS